MSDVSATANLELMERDDGEGSGHPGLEEELSPKQVQLVRAAYWAIGEKGVRRLSLQQVADAAGVSKGLIFYYFKTREGLILATMRWVLSRVAERIRRAVDPVQGAEDKVVAMVDVIFADADANRRFYSAYLDLVDHALRLDDFSKLSATFRGIVNSLYAEVIARGVAQGAFRVDDVEEAATAVRAVVEGLFLQWLQEEDRARVHPRYRELCKRAVLAYLNAPGTGARLADPSAWRRSLSGRRPRFDVLP